MVVVTNTSDHYIHLSVSDVSGLTARNAPRPARMVKGCQTQPVLVVLLLVQAASGRHLPRLRTTLFAAREDGLVPSVAGSSHNVEGYEGKCAVDGDEKTFWLVPGGQRMEMMS